MQVEFQATIKGNRHKIMIESGNGLISISNIHGEELQSTSRWAPDTARRIAQAILDAVADVEAELKKEGV